MIDGYSLSLVQLSLKNGLELLIPKKYHFDPVAHIKLRQKTAKNIYKKIYILKMATMIIKTQEEIQKAEKIQEKYCSIRKVISLCIHCIDCDEEDCRKWIIFIMKTISNFKWNRKFLTVVKNYSGFFFKSNFISFFARFWLSFG